MPPNTYCEVGVEISFKPFGSWLVCVKVHHTTTPWSRKLVSKEMKTLSQKHRTTACVAGRFVTGHQENEERTGLDNSVVLTGNKLLLHEQRGVDLTSTDRRPTWRSATALVPFCRCDKNTHAKASGGEELTIPGYRPSLLWDTKPLLCDNRFRKLVNTRSFDLTILEQWSSGHQPRRKAKLADMAI